MNLKDLEKEKQEMIELADMMHDVCKKNIEKIIEEIISTPVGWSLWVLVKPVYEDEKLTGGELQLATYTQNTSSASNWFVTSFDGFDPAEDFDPDHADYWEEVLNDIDRVIYPEYGDREKWINNEEYWAGTLYRRLTDF